MKYLSRIDRVTAGSSGWCVRIRVLTCSKFFSDAKHGGRDGALRAAVAWRKKTMRAAGVPLSDRMVVIGQRRGGTGIPGISIQRRRGRAYYVVSYAAEAGRKSRKVFRIPADKTGQRQALREAVAFRRQQEQAIYGETIAANWNRAIGAVCEK